MRSLKRDGRREDLSRQKLLSGIETACEKRAISREAVEKLVDGLIEELEASHEREVPSETIGQLVMNRLEKLDEVAFVRFASVYRRFRDVNQFLNEIQGMMRKE